MSTPGAPIPLTEQPCACAGQPRLLPWLVAVAFFMESLDTTILNTGGAGDCQGAHVAPLSMKAVLASYTLEPGGVYPDQRLDGGPVWHPAGVCLRDRAVHAGLVSVRHSSNIHLLVACRVLQGCGGAMMVPVGG